ncbi:helix-turn-helix domain-containing protein [bacterium]|nr:helix-turn-helix domain-containing protein [bacterium]
MPKVTSNEGKPYAEIGTLLRNLRLRRGLSQFELANAAGINNSYLSRIENGERRPSPKILKRFSEILEHPYDDLVVKSGILSEEFVRSTAPAIQQAPIDTTTEVLQKIIQNMQHGQMPLAGTQPAATSRAVPVFDTVPAGLLKEANVVEAYDDVEKLVLNEAELGYDPKAFALIVKGDSMVDAGILDGDVLIISPNTPVQNGQIGVAQINRRTTTVKRIYVENNVVILHPANSEYKPQVLAPPDEVEILGKVILVRRKMF